MKGDAYAWNLSIWESKAGGLMQVQSLFYIVSLRPARVTQWKHLKQLKKEKKEMTVWRKAERVSR